MIQIRWNIGRHRRLRDVFSPAPNAMLHRAAIEHAIDHIASFRSAGADFPLDSIEPDYLPGDILFL
jgi:hypothetical protein